MKEKIYRVWQAAYERDGQTQYSTETEEELAWSFDVNDALCMTMEDWKEKYGDLIGSMLFDNESEYPIIDFGEIGYQIEGHSQYEDDNFIGWMRPAVPETNWNELAMYLRSGEKS